MGVADRIRFVVDSANIKCASCGDRYVRLRCTLPRLLPKRGDCSFLIFDYLSSELMFYGEPPEPYHSWNVSTTLRQRMA
jgi:hypothetical protein